MRFEYYVITLVIFSISGFTGRKRLSVSFENVADVAAVNPSGGLYYLNTVKTGKKRVQTEKIRRDAADQIFYFDHYQDFMISTNITEDRPDDRVLSRIAIRRHARGLPSKKLEIVDLDLGFALRDLPTIPRCSDSIERRVHKTKYGTIDYGYCSSRISKEYTNKDRGDEIIGYVRLAVHSGEFYRKKCRPTITVSLGKRNVYTTKNQIDACSVEWPSDEATYFKVTRAEKDFYLNILYWDRKKKAGNLYETQNFRKATRRGRYLLPLSSIQGHKDQGSEMLPLFRSKNLKDKSLTGGPYTSIDDLSTYYGKRVKQVGRLNVSIEFLTPSEYVSLAESEEGSAQGSPARAGGERLYIPDILNLDSKIRELPEFRYYRKSIPLLDRRTGLLVEEYIELYLRQLLKLMYKRRITREAIVKTQGFKNFLQRLTVVQSSKKNMPKSSKQIPGFIKKHNIFMGDFQKKEYESFNDFFRRDLVPGARVFGSDCLCSPADSRLILYEQISDTTEFWIKGSAFSLQSLLSVGTQPENSKYVEMFLGGSIAIFRLAPQDYHKFHFPVRGRLDPERVVLDGSFYTVSPIAVNQNIRVLDQNQRILQLLHTEDGKQKIGIIAVGASYVGSIKYSVDEGPVRPEDVYGYFEFGGSTIILLFEPNGVVFDKDIFANSYEGIETIVRVGECVGRFVGGQ